MRRLEEHPNLLLVIAGFSFYLGASLAAADPALPDLAVRTELISINTLTLSDAQFLTGDTNGKATTTAGQLRIARGSDRLPVVVLQHGSGGMGANIEMWAREFNAMGVSTFALDGFTGRGLTQVGTNQALLGRLNFVLDIYRGLEALAKHPRVDSQRIVLMGLFPRRPSGTLCQPQAIPPNVEQVGYRICGIYSVLPRLRDHVCIRYRGRGPADPYLRRYAGRLQSNQTL